MSSESLLHLLLTFKYLALFILVVVEGFFSTVAGGALSAQGIMNIFAVWLVVIAADLTSDFLFYTFGKKISKSPVAKFLGLSPKQIIRVEKLFDRLGTKTIIFAKLSSYLAIPVIVAAGAIHMPKKRFYTYCAAAATIKATILVMLGFFFGKQIHHLVNAVIIASVGISIAVLSYWVGSHLLHVSKTRSQAS
ncbi:MAG: hypothetical protein JWO47_926 [Candidatus Saccharibacteria bacterium]|nr:hypothetical protein [Candidatus Saccharibacteria bacterium]